ncbi:MAG: glycosyltransferase [Hyphomicrobiaceae bacterium]
MTRPSPTILQIIPRLDTGGAELSAIEITAAIVRAGGRALVATEGGRMADRITSIGGTLIPFAAATKNPIRIVTNASELRRLIAAQAIDLLHARSRAPAWSALLAARRAKVPFVTTYHGAYGENGQLKRLYNSVMVRADRVIANSGFTADLIRQRYRTDPARITVIHRGVDIAAFDPARIAPDRVAALRRQWSIPDQRPIILQAGRLTDWKGQRVTIEAIDRLHQSGRLGPVAMVFAGDDQGRDGYADMLRREVHNRGLDAVVHFAGHVSDMAAAFVAAHVAVIASTKPEAFGRTATEAQAMGCPVIATDIGAPRETVLAAGVLPPGTETGWLVPPSDPVALAAGIAAALALSQASREALGKRARRNVEANFTLEAMQRSTLAVYDSLLGTDLANRFSTATAP